MKRTTLSALFITASILAAPVFAAGNNCESNLATVNNGIATFSAPTENAKDNLVALRDKAVAAQKAGDEKACVGYTGQAMDILSKNAKTKN